MTLEALSVLKVLVLFLTGDADLYTPAALLARMAARVPQARAAVVEGSGHAPHWERPDAFNALMLDFIRAAR
jgi:pimeloyl-ACP methyl ester carboxylesterase